MLHYATGWLVDSGRQNDEKCSVKLEMHSRARNNFRIVSSHDDRPNSFLLGHVSFQAGQMYMMNYSFRGP